LIMPQMSRVFDELTAFEAGSGADEGEGKGDEVRCVQGPPPLLGGSTARGR